MAKRRRCVKRDFLFLIKEVACRLGISALYAKGQPPHKNLVYLIRFYWADFRQIWSQLTGLHTVRINIENVPLRHTLFAKYFGTSNILECQQTEDNENEGATVNTKHPTSRGGIYKPGGSQ